jgi:hypothetical protein
MQPTERRRTERFNLGIRLSVSVLDSTAPKQRTESLNVSAEVCTLQRFCPYAEAPGFGSSLGRPRKSPTCPQATGFVRGT